MDNDHEDSKLCKTDLERLQKTMVELSKIFISEDNIHKHTALLGATCRAQVMPLAHKYALDTQTSSLADTIEEVRNHTDIADRPAVNRVLNAIQDKAGQIEPETGLSLSDFFIKTWALTKHPQAPQYSTFLVIDCLRHNIQAGGGCLAGIAGRLTHPYSYMVSQILAKIYENQQGLTDFIDTMRRSPETSSMNGRLVERAYLNLSDERLANLLIIEQQRELGFSRHKGTEFDLFSMTQSMLDPNNDDNASAYKKSKLT